MMITFFRATPIDLIALQRYAGRTTDVERSHGSGAPVPDFKLIIMSTLSDKIRQLMTYESQLKTLNTEITTQRAALVDTPEIYIHNDMFEERLKKYELISLKYNELLESILPDLNKMSEEYRELRNRRKSHPFFFR